MQKNRFGKYNSFRKLKELGRKASRFVRSIINVLPSIIGSGSHAFSPVRIKLYINDMCNASCIMCDIGTGNMSSVFSRQVKNQEGRILTPEDISGLINEVKDFNPEIDIHGLEPLMHKDLDTILRIIKEADLRIYLITNGILLKENAESLIRNEVDKITISIDGPEEIHDMIRGKGTYEKAVEGIAALKNHRLKAGSKTPEIAAHLTITHLNYNKLSDYFDLMTGELGVDTIYFSHPYFVPNNASTSHQVNYPDIGESSPVNIGELKLDLINIETLWEQLEMIREKMNWLNSGFNIKFRSIDSMRDYYKSPEKHISGISCKIPWKTSTITANGDVIINNRCFMYKTGNIHEQNFLSIWRGEKYKIFRRELAGNKIFPPCKRCCGTAPGIRKI